MTTLRTIADVLRRAILAALLPAPIDVDDDDVETSRFRFVDPPGVEPAQIVPQSGHAYRVENSVSLHTVAGMFAAHGWQLARPGHGPQPSAYEIADMLADMVLTAENATDPNAFYQMARFVALKSSEFPNDVDLFLHIATATRIEENPDGPEEDPDYLAGDAA